MTAAQASAAAGPLPFAVRIGTHDDQAFVMDSWYESEKDASAHLEGPRFTRWQKAYQRDVLSRPSTCLRVAYPSDDPQTILGWLAYSTTSPAVVYYVFTRYHLRQLGLAKLLLGELLTAPEVLYCARPPRLFDSVAKVWVSNPILPRIPQTWKFQARAAHYLP